MKLHWKCLKDEVERKKFPWPHFHEAMDLNKNLAMVICKQCRKSYPHPQTKADRNSTNLHKHARSHSAQEERVVRASQQQNIQSLFGQQTSLNQVGITSSELQWLFLQTMITCNWPFDQFENKLFRNLIHQGFSEYTCPQRKGMM